MFEKLNYLEKDKHHLSEDEIIRDWKLDCLSKELVLKINKNHRLWFSVQLCSMKLYGRFLENPNELSNQVISYICKQLTLFPSITVRKPIRKATYIGHRKLIFEHLGFVSFSDQYHEMLKEWSIDKMDKGILLVEHLHPQAERFLISNHIALPSFKQLRRIIKSLSVQYQKTIFYNIYSRLSINLIHSIDKILTVTNEEANSLFNQLKEYPSSATITSLKLYIIKYQKLCEINLQDTGIEILNSNFTMHLYQLGKYYSADKVKRIKPEKRYCLMIAFLCETKKILVDYIIQMHDQYISSICRECKHIHEEQIRQYRYKYDKAINQLISVVDKVLCYETEDSILLQDIYKSTIPKELLKQARADMNTYQIMTKFGYTHLLQNRYNSMRRYFIDFIKLPFHAETADYPLIKAINLIRDIDNKELKSLPSDAPYEFIDYKIKTGIFNIDKSLKRNAWEIGVAIAIRDATRSGDIYLPQSKKYVSFWDLVYKNDVWENTNCKAYDELNLYQDPLKAIERIKSFYHETASLALSNFGKDGFAAIKNGKLKLTKQDKLIIPEEVKDYQKIIASYMPKIKIEQLLLEVDRMTGFSRHFTPIHGQNSKPKKFYKTLMASILSQATNIGIATMQDCTTDITTEMLHHVIDTYIREETIRKANAELVNQHSGLPLSCVHGQGKISSSDAQRFGITASSLIASYYPRYFGYYEKAIGIYTHVSDQYSVYNTKVISCSPREALYVIDGLLENNTTLEIKEHTTDTAGYTEHIFALCYLLGYQFMPRIRDLKDQQLYRINKDVSYQELNSVLNKYIDLEMIVEQWDNMVRIIASLKNKLAPAHEIIRRIGKGTPSDNLSKAFTQLGRIIKTEYILRYLTTPKLRQKVQRQLNKGEHRHALSRWIFFANQGKFQIGDYEEIMNKSSCLSLVSNAVLYWNTIKMNEIIEQLELVNKKIDKQWLSHISLLSYKHVIPMGTYFIEKEEEQITG